MVSIFHSVWICYNYYDNLWRIIIISLAAYSNVYIDIYLTLIPVSEENNINFDNHVRSSSGQGAVYVFSVESTQGPIITTAETRPHQSIEILNPVGENNNNNLKVTPN
jgi:hypothetical protein